MNLEYKGFWMSVKPLNGPLRYECEIVNIKHNDYKNDTISKFYICPFYAHTDNEVQKEFHKRVEALITLDIGYDNFNEEVFTKKYLDEILEIKP